MELHTDDLAINGRTRREQEIENFKKIINEAADLHGEINQEIKDRQAADTTERSERMTADSIERSARISTDTYLQNQINDLRIRLTTAEGNIVQLQSRVSTLEDQVKKLNEIIFGTQYINDTDDIPVDDSMTPNPNDEEIQETEVVNDDATVKRLDGYTTLDHEVN